MAEPHERLDSVKIFMDESGNGHPSLPLIVGAAELGEDADDIEEQIQNLYKRLSARSNLAGLRGFEKFRKKGFHSTDDPQEVSGPFLELMRAIFYRTYMVVTNRTNVPGDTEDEQIEFMYAKLLSDLLIRHRDKTVLSCYIEQGESMNSIIARLPAGATKQAHQTLGDAAPLPQLEIQMVAKTDYMSTAIIDYVMAAVSRWFQAGRPTSSSEYHYRAFREIEPSISILYSFEDGVISRRGRSLH
jgi:hypothetical protein